MLWLRNIAPKRRDDLAGHPRGRRKIQQVRRSLASCFALIHRGKDFLTAALTARLAFHRPRSEAACQETLEEEE